MKTLHCAYYACAVGQNLDLFSFLDLGPGRVFTSASKSIYFAFFVKLEMWGKDVPLKYKKYPSLFNFFCSYKRNVIR